jgi:hypothetical protein
LAGRSPAEAVQAFLAPLQQALACLTPTVLNVSGGYYVADRPHALTLGDGDPVMLSGDHALSLAVAQNYRLVEFEGPRGPWKVQTTAYFYELRRSDEELLVYHWHPRGASPFTNPHLHIGSGAELGFAPLEGAHVPTGRIALEEILRLAITELGARPRRSDWEEVLERTQAGYEAWRTWPTPRAGERD